MKKMLFMLAALLISLGSTALWAAEGCTINTVHGMPKVLRGDQTLALKAGDTLKKGDLITTPTEQCMVDMSMNDLAGCRVLSGSKLEVTAWKKENMAVKIVDGNIILNLKKLPEDAAFKVETPTAVAVVRGTQFWGRVQDPSIKAVTTFAVREGSVEITPLGITDGGPITLKPGQALDIAKDSGTFLVRQALPEEMTAMEQATAISTTPNNNAK